MNDRPSLWWAYDAEDGRFSTLPASPLLLPALLFMACAAIGRAIFSPVRVLGHTGDPIEKTQRYQQSYKRWRELCRRQLNGDDLAVHELYEKSQLFAYICNPYGHKRP